MANAPCARLTKPISPIVTDSPTETMNSTMPAATPPSSMLTMFSIMAPRSDGTRARASCQSPRTGAIPQIVGGMPQTASEAHLNAKPPPIAGRRPLCAGSSGSGAGRDLLRLAGILHVVDLADHLLLQGAVLAL